MVRVAHEKKSEVKIVTEQLQITDGFQTLFGANDQQEVHVKSSPATKDESPSDSIDLTSMKYSLPFQVEFPKRGRDDSISSGKFLKASSELMKIYGNTNSMNLKGP